MHELTDRITPLEAVLTDLPTGRLEDTDDVHARFGLVNAWLHARLAPAALRCPVRWATEAILASGGRITVARIACATGLGERQLERRFRALVGVSPKSLARVIRFSRAFQLAQSARHPNWAKIAYRTGYYDQAHLCRDFSMLAMCSPQQARFDPAVDRWCSALDSDRFLGEMSGFSNTRTLRCA